MEVGDRFKFKKTKLNKGCYYIEKEYIAKNFSKSGLSVYYEFNITNNKCKCIQCKDRRLGLNSIAIYDTYITRTKKEFDRNHKINKILYKS